MSDITAKDIITWVIGFSGPLAVGILYFFLNRKMNGQKKEFAEKLESWKAELGVEAYVKKKRYDRMVKVADPLRNRMIEAYESVIPFFRDVKMHLGESRSQESDEKERLSDEALKRLYEFMQAESPHVFEQTNWRMWKFVQDLGSLHIAASAARVCQYIGPAREGLDETKKGIKPDIGTQLKELQKSIQADIKKGP